ncbi:hypothetical protein [Paeniglutamicibacter terrestris]|uniref:Uncharacterized protein n=1 Tax=Paeniglutamicibacter terrestris TaxID=2723403 RepID=A0ABX1G584_9MICC|nr:hypothetical protein [Paeniglutamicibacter terrestris]NKG21129.1 hypothetical protein [Paeniglutamicibacter terrestris]
MRTETQATLTGLASLSAAEFAAAFDEAIECGDNMRDFHIEQRRRRNH